MTAYTSRYSVLFPSDERWIHGDDFWTFIVPNVKSKPFIAKSKPFKSNIVYLLIYTKKLGITWLTELFGKMDMDKLKPDSL